MVRIACLSSMLLLSLPCAALKFEDATPEEAGKMRVLWVRDCGQFERDAGTGCKPWETGFRGLVYNESGRVVYPGDAYALEERLAQRELRGIPYDEVWLRSNGGDLVQGVSVGAVLRRHQATVRVPRGARCISSCTVAFLGGLFRIVDEGATYEVHAASGYLSGFRTKDDERTLKRLTSGRIEDIEEELKRFAEQEHQGKPITCRYPADNSGILQYQQCAMGSRAWAWILFVHFQQALLPPGRSRGNEQELNEWFRNPPRLSYVTSQRLKQDAVRIQAEGEATVQEILMRLERDCMAEAIAELRARAVNLGPRAEPALKILEAMYSSRITGTASLSQETLLSMGYTTKFFSMGGR